MSPAQDEDTDGGGSFLQPAVNGHGQRRFVYDGLDAGMGVQGDGRLETKILQQDPSVAALLEKLDRSRRACEPHEQLLTSRPNCHRPDQDCFPLTLNIVIHVVGSRGDVQPFVALGKGLKQHGHRVRLATHHSFKNFVVENGLEFFNIGGDPSEMMAFMVRNPGLLPDFETVRSGDLQRHRECIKCMVCGSWHSCYEPGEGSGCGPGTRGSGDRHFVADAIIANPPSFAHVNCAEKLGIPLHMMFTMPWSATRTFPHPLANVKQYRAKPSVANFVSYAIVEMIMWQGLGDIFNKFRKRELGLRPLDGIWATSLLYRLKVPYTYLWSPTLLPKPDDWPDYIDISGFCSLSSGTNYTPPEELDRFLKSGSSPVYIGFGSIVVDDPQKLTKSVFDAIKETGERAIISKGWGNLGGGGAIDVPENVYLIDNCPHDWLFQHVTCVVHHGGAGTTATGLSLGRPTVVISFFGDQLFWGSIVARAGVGPKPIRYGDLTSGKLAAAIKKALEGSTLERAREIGEQMRNEDGVENAVHSFHRHLDLSKLRCALVPYKPAAWQVKHSETKLSAVAAAVLVDAGCLNLENLILHRPNEYDTNRDPRGPISAGAEVLVGAISNFISGVGVLPLEMLQIFTATRVIAHCQPKDTHHLPAQPPTAGPAPAHSESNSNTSLDYQDQDQDSEGRDSEQFDTENQIRDLRLTKANTKEARKPACKSRIEDTGAAANRFAKRFINGVILLPMDLTMSLSRGFHNAPKLYHDRTVKPTRRVVGIRGGFQVAGEELVSGFYNGVTGLVTQPYHEAQRSGARDLPKGLGKGVGGVFLKPAAGLWGLAGYPLQGLHMHIRKSLAKTSATQTIKASRLEQGLEEMETLSGEEHAEIIKKWRHLTGGRI